jgi:hypothetical protein
MDRMEIAIRDRKTRPWRWTTLLAMLSATALLAAAAQLLAPAPASAMTEEEGAGDPQCQMLFWWDIEACDEDEDGGGGGGSSGDGSSGDGSYDPCAEFGHCSSGDPGDQGGSGSPSDDPHGDVCARYSACDASAKDPRWEPKDGWVASDEEEADAAEEALGEADQRALERNMLRRAAGAERRPCEDRFRNFVHAPAGEDEDAAFQQWRECLLEHRNDRRDLPRADRATKDRGKRLAGRAGKRGPGTATRRG